MTAMSCTAVRRALQTLHDGEIAVALQIDVEAHLSQCAECARQREELSALGAMIRAGGAGPAAGDYDDELLAGVMSSVIVQAQGERCRGWCGRVVRAFADGSRVWIPGGAVAMTATAAVVLAVILSLLTPTQQDSLAAVLKAQASPGSNANPVSVVRGVSIPTVAPERLPVFLSLPPENGDSDLALAAVVTREGEVSRLEVLRSNVMSDDLILDLDRLTADVRFSPALYGGSPVAVNVVWLVERTTVRGDESVPLS